MALWDIAGKGLQRSRVRHGWGGKFRDKIRIYADTTESKDPKIYAQRMKERKEAWASPGSRWTWASRWWRTLPAR